MSASAHIALFKELLDMSKAQSDCITDGRLDDAVKLLEEREALIARLKDDNVRLDSSDSEARAIIKKITINDEHIMLVLTEQRDGTAERLKKRIEAKKVISAYNETDKTR